MANFWQRVHIWSHHQAPISCTCTCSTKAIEQDVYDGVFVVVQIPKGADDSVSVILQIPKHEIVMLMPQLTLLLTAESNKVHSYAAICIERLLSMKVRRCNVSHM